jgi:hypothetical protein
VNNKYYLFHALDVATYFKWAHVARHNEVSILNELWMQRQTCLAVDEQTSFDDFVQDVYMELNWLWRQGFVDEFSDFNLALDLFLYPQVMSQKRYARVEQYFKMLALLFILTPHLPYTLLDLGRIINDLGYRRCSKTLARCIIEMTDKLGLRLVKANGFPCGESYIRQGGTVLIGMSVERSQQLAEAFEENLSMASSAQKQKAKSPDFDQPNSIGRALAHFDPAESP